MKTTITFIVVHWVRILAALRKGRWEYVGCLAALLLSSCVPAAYPVDSPNPLDEPGASAPTQTELHVKNLKQITGNHAYR